MAQDVINAGLTTPRVYGLLGFAQSYSKDSLIKVKGIGNTRVYIEKSDTKVPPSDYITFGKMFLNVSQADSAEVYFNKALAMDTTAASKTGLYREIAEGFRLAKNWKKSAEWYAKTAEQADAQPIDYFWAGTMYYYGNNYTDAGAWFEKAEVKFPDQQFPAYWRGRVAAAIDNEAKTGTAAPFYTKWLEKVGPTYDKKADLMQAYQYLYLYAFNTNDKTAMKKYRDLIVAIEPNNPLVKQIEEATKKS
jgi:tetratricopeptide (TPR) repeat protein